MPDQSGYDPTGVNRRVPSVAAGAGLGTAPPAPVIDPASSDQRGLITFGSGTVPAAGAILTVTFSVPRDPGRLPKVLLQEATAATAGIDVAVTSVTANGFTLSQATRNVAASQAANTYGFYYLVVD